jgi:drug/metabolite transporter (DMT)-like permease
MLDVIRPRPTDIIGEVAVAHAEIHDTATLAATPAAAFPAAAGGQPGVWRDRVIARRMRLMDWWRGAPHNLRGSIYMVTAFLFLSAMIAGVKATGTRIPLVEVLVVRQIIIALLLAPVFIHGGMATLRTRHPWLQIMRGLFALGAMSAGFTALHHIPLAEATAIGFSQALFVTVAAVFVLKEKVGPRRWLATAIGFTGVMIMLRPGGHGLDSYALLAVLGALFGCGITITVRILASRERTETIMAYQTIVLFTALSYPAWQSWVWPSRDEWLLLVFIGVVGTVGQWLSTRAYQVGDAAALAPLDFVRLLIATAIGYLLFAETLTLSTMIGGTIVVASTLYTVRHNARRAPRAELLSDPATT